MFPSVIEFSLGQFALNGSKTSLDVSKSNSLLHAFRRIEQRLGQ